MAAAPRILLSGDVLGRLRQLFKRVSSVNKSAGPFDALLCLGQFFPESPDQLEEFNDYLEGRSQIPIPIYFIGDYGVAKILSAAAKNLANLGFKMDGLKVLENLYWLRGSGKFTLHGLSVVYLSGRQSVSVQQFGTYSQDDVDSLRAFSEEHGIVDLFLTNECPKGVTNGAAASEVTSGMSDSSTGDSTLSDLVSEIKPRYHIAGTVGVYYDREPHVNVGAVHVTRFLALGSIGNKNKQKFLHALSPMPSSMMSAADICTKPPKTTLSPYSFSENASSAEQGVKNLETVVLIHNIGVMMTLAKDRNMEMVMVRGCALNLYPLGCVREERSATFVMTQRQENSLSGVCVFIF